MDYAVELELLDSNPMKAIKWRAPTTSTTREVDRRSVVNHRQARALLDAVKTQQPSGPRLVAFFALMYYSGLRPEEAINVDRHALVLPPAEEPAAWGEIHLTSAAPHAGSHWTNDGSLRETRALKHRIEGESRPVPTPPPLVAILRTTWRNFPMVLRAGCSTASAPRLCRRRRTCRYGGPPARPRLRRVSRPHRWLAAPTTCGTPASPRGSTPASPTQVAAWAGHGVDVLLKIYARCVEGQDEVAKRRIEAALDDGLGDHDEDAAADR